LDLLIAVAPHFVSLWPGPTNHDGATTTTITGFFLHDLPVKFALHDGRKSETRMEQVCKRG
jgi:hypothetical protein